MSSGIMGFLTRKKYYLLFYTSVEGHVGRVFVSGKAGTIGEMEKYVSKKFGLPKITCTNLVQLTKRQCKRLAGKSFL